MKRRQVLRAQASKSQTGSSSRRFANSGPVLPFNPASIPGCQLWLDAADSSSVLVNSSSNVLTWIDKSGNGYHMDTLPPYSYIVDNPSYPTIGTSINGKGTVNFNPSAGLKQSTTLDGVKNFFWVGATGPPTGEDIGSLYFMLGHDTHLDWCGNGYTTKMLAPGFAAAGILNASPTSVFTSDTNSAVTNATFSTVNTPSLSTPFLLSVAGITGSTRYQGICYDRGVHTGWCGNLGEVIIFNSALTTIQRQKVEGYLAHKWGLQTSLPANHPHKTTAPTYEQPVFVPTLISGSQLWLDGADSSTITGTTSVTAWRDKSTNAYVANSFVNSVANPSSVSNIQNGNGVIRYTAGNGSSIANFVLAQTMSIFMLYYPINQSTGSPFIEQGPNAGSESGFFFHSQNDNNFYIKAGSVGIANFGTTTVSNTWQLIQGINPDPANGNTMAFYVNGTTIASGGTQSDTTTVTKTLYINGRAGTGNVSYNTYLAELIIYNTALTPSQRQRVEGYIAQKWGLQSSLPANHPFKTIAPTGIPRSITIQSLSALFNNSTLSVPANAAVTLGTNNHTIEFWMYQTSRGQYDTAFSYNSTATSFATNKYYMNVGSYIAILVGNGSDNWAVYIGETTISPLPSLNTWHHYAIVRNGTTFTLYINGISRGIATSSVSIGAQSGPFVIVGDSSSTANSVIRGYISNFRLVNGTAVYTSNFTPPTSPLTAIPNTQVLLQGLVDRSPNAFTVTNTGGVTVSTLSPFV